MPIFNVIPAPETLSISGADKSLFALDEQQQKMLLSVLSAAPTPAIDSRISSLFADRDGLTDEQADSLMQLLADTQADLIVAILDDGLRQIIVKLGGSAPDPAATWNELLCQLYTLLGGADPCQQDAGALLVQIGDIL